MSNPQGVGRALQGQRPRSGTLGGAILWTFGAGFHTMPWFHVKHGRKGPVSCPPICQPSHSFPFLLQFLPIDAIARYGAVEQFMHGPIRSPYSYGADECPAAETASLWRCRISLLLPRNCGAPIRCLNPCRVWIAPGLSGTPAASSRTPKTLGCITNCAGAAGGLCGCTSGVGCGAVPAMMACFRDVEAGTSRNVSRETRSISARLTDTNMNQVGPRSTSRKVALGYGRFDSDGCSRCEVR